MNRDARIDTTTITGLLALLACLFALLTPSPAIAVDDSEQVVLSDRFFYRFLELYQDDPGALGRFASGLRNLTPEQMREAVDVMGATQFTYLAPMVIPGHEFPDLKDTPLADLSLMAIRGERLVPIPFQFDEYDAEGLIWINGVSSKPSGQPGRLDNTDELIFMFRDGGFSTYDLEQHGPVEGEILREIHLTPSQKDKRIVYLVRNNPQRSDAHYVHVDLNEGRIDSTVVEMLFDPQNLTNIHHVASKVGVHTGENVFDNINIHLSTGILNPNFRINLNSQRNIRAVPIAVKEGPVRARVLLRARIWYLGLPTLLSHKFDLIFYEQGVVIPTQFAIDSLGVARYFISLLREPKLEFSIDFNQLEGAQVTYDAIYEDGRYALVDGQMSPLEQEMNQRRMHGDWLHLNSNRGWEMFFHNRIPVTEGGLFDQFLEGVNMNMIYNDDLDHQEDHQQFRGNLPRLGFRSSGLPEPAMALLTSTPRLPRNVRTLGDAIYYLADDPDRRQQRMDRYDNAARTILQQLHKNGFYSSAEELAEAFITDMGRMRFTGIPRDSLGDLLRDAVTETVTDLEDIRHGQILAAMIRLAKKRGINLRDLRHATMDNALWFPAWIGPDGATGFYEEVKNPPTARIKHFETRPIPELDQNH